MVRPAKLRDFCRVWIIIILKEKGIATIDKLKREINERTEKKLHWYTIEKYTNELIEENKIQKIQGNPSREIYRKPLFYYFISQPKPNIKQIVPDQ